MGVYILDPATGGVSLITQAWVFPLAQKQLGLSPDGKREAVVAKDDILAAREAVQAGLLASLSREIQKNLKPSGQVKPLPELQEQPE